MIQLASFDYDALAGEYTPDSVQAQVLAAMQASEAVYAFPSLDALRFQLDLRHHIVQASLELYDSYMGFAVFEETRCNPDFWDRRENGGFLLKPGVPGSQAIEDIFINSRLYATECATAMVIVYYKALLDLLGPETFDRLFDRIFLMNWRVSDPLLREVSTPHPVPELLLGDRAYINNPDVSPETPWWQGENVIVLPDNLFYGHGIGIAKEEQIVRILNSQRREDAEQSAYLMDVAGRPDFNKLYRAASRATEASRLVWQPFPPPLAPRA